MLREQRKKNPRVTTQEIERDRESNGQTSLHERKNEREGKQRAENILQKLSSTPRSFYV